MAIGASQFLPAIEPRRVVVLDDAAGESRGATCCWTRQAGCRCTARKRKKRLVRCWKAVRWIAWWWAGTGHGGRAVSC